MIPRYQSVQPFTQGSHNQQTAGKQPRGSFQPTPKLDFSGYNPAPTPGKQPVGSFQPMPRSAGPGGDAGRVGLSPEVYRGESRPGAVADAMARYNESKRRREAELARNPTPNTGSFTGTDAEWDEWRGGGYDAINRQYSPGAAQPNMPQSQGTPYGFNDHRMRYDPPAGQGAQQIIPRPSDPGDWSRPPAPRPSDPGDWSRPQPVYPPDFEGPLPGPPKSREDEIYDQLMAGNFGASLKGIPSAQGRRAQNARETARRIVASENAAATSTDRRAKPTYERALRQYGIRPPAGGLPTPPPAPPEEPDPVFGGTPYQPGGSMPNWGAPGAAQPSMPPSQGTPYGEQINKWGGSPQVGTQPGNDPVSQLGNLYQQQMTAWAQPKQQLLQWGQQMSQMPWGPNYGNTPDSRPAPWSQQVSGQFGNNQSDMWNNIGGFIQSVNNQAMQKPVGTYLGQGNPGPQYGRQNYDIRSLINQGNQMVQGGWQNPFMGQMQQVPQWYG